jgi:amino acid transporter
MANLTPMVGEVRDPRRNIPRAYLFAMLVVGGLYLFVNASYFFALTRRKSPASRSVLRSPLR